MLASENYPASATGHHLHCT